MVEFQIVDSGEAINRVAKLAVEIWREHYLPIIGEKQVIYMLDRFQSPGAIQQQIDEGYQYYLIMDNSGKNNIDVGYFSVQLRSQKLFLSKLYVLNSCRSRGIGKAAIKFILHSFNYPVIQLTVNKYNAASIGFYQAVGFEIIDSVVGDIGNGFVMDDYVMELV